MHINKKSILTMLALVGISAMAFPAKGATIANGDLVLYFRASGGTGANSVLAVRVGSSAYYKGLTSQVTLTGGANNIGNVAGLTGTGPNTLATTFGANWATRSDLFWGVAGGNSTLDSTGTSAGDPFRTVYLTQAQGSTLTPGAQNSTSPGISSADADSVSTAIGGTLLTRFRQENGTSNVTGTGPVTFDTSTVFDTWASFQSGGTSFGQTYSAEAFDATAPTGITNTALDLYRLLAIGGTNGFTATPGSAAQTTYLGSFGINSSGSISFSPNVAVIPEPSRSLLVGIAVGAMLIRRRRSRMA